MKMSSLKAIGFRAVRSLVTLLLCVTLVFVILRAAGDPSEELLPPETPPDIRQEYRVQWGLDRPIVVQYLNFLSRVARGDLGESFASDLPATELVMRAIPKTILLGGSAFLLATLIGMSLGVTAALRHGTAVDRSLIAAAVLGYSMPVFFLGILLILVFALQLRVLPSSGSSSPVHLILPTITLALPLAGRVARFARTATLEVMGKPFIRTARAKGLGQLAVILGHALPNAMVPLLMFFGIEIGLILSGAVVTETIFAWPGLGRLLVDSVNMRDLPVVQAVILMITLIIVLSNLFVDILHALLDPKVSLARTLGGAG
ncbi:peptide/nickel transport system permease protein [Rhizobium petrolearium]|uniref:ABC transporter permease n=1 Tax=Neorhizobium petrolearium TaxID=515361 RepID=UPI001AE9CF94|nr:ABC transporter permease [Neorhizobium petrolearium]MBP1847407.1 peptide/nickel transport system permease protein [Neorhizobium petrolearium]